MLFVPSPDILVHTASNNQRHLLIYQQDPESKCFVLQGLMAKELGDLDSAIFFLTESATAGNVAAMIELGSLYVRKCDSKQALQWFSRARRHGSVDALRRLGALYLMEKNYERALFFYYEHFNQTRSCLTAFRIGKTLEQLHSTAGIKWLKFSAAHGLRLAVDELVGLGSAFWEKLRPRKNRTNYRLLLNSKQVKDASLPALESALWGLRDPFIGKEAELSRRINRYVRVGHIEKDPIRQQRDVRIGFWWPSDSEINKLLAILEMASEDEEKRNLRLCNCYLKHCRMKNSLFPFNLYLWRRKVASEDPKDLIRCGFVSCLLGDYKYAFSLFQKASATGNEVGALMCGLILYYGFGAEKDPQIGIFCMARCHLNPIALMHLWVASDEKNSWCHRAKSLLSGGQDYPEIYEWVGDYFNNGVKFPRQVKIALSWYYMQLVKSEKHGLDTNRIVEKISLLTYERACED